jgi:sialate O-acetylesterase
MRRLILVTFAVAGLMAPARADVKLPALFSDGLVLQQESKCPIWGSADPGEMVKVTLTGGKTLAGAVKAGEDGKWRVDLATGKAGGPYTLTVAGKNTITLKDVYLGEVWIASGQSNMEWSVNASANAAEVKKSSHNPQIRLFTVRKTVADSPRDDMPRDDYHGKWHECGPDTVGRLSAVAYHFGRYLHETRGVPVGLIHTSWGGTVAEAWTPRAALEAEPSLMGLVPQGEIRSGNPNQGTVLYNGMIAPLLPYTIKGAIWYQGESNAGRAHQYRTLFPTMIASWREAWKNPDMPFFFVQLAPWRNPSAQPMESDWAELREAQRLTSLTVRKTGMAVITDVGDAADIHPRQKEPVGVRLALGARAIAYGEKIEYSGPVYQAMEVEGKRVTLRFTHVGKGLEARYGNPIGFTVAGEDRKFHNANAEIKGDTVVVWCDKVTKPVAVRFGWANCPIVDLWNKDGLPASPFRTDDFPMRTQPKP